MAATRYSSPSGLTDMVGQLNMRDLLHHRQHARLDQYNPRLPYHNGAPMGSPRGPQEKFKDAIEYQFWPKRVGMGTLKSGRFVQMLGASVEYGLDEDSKPIKGMGKSYLAFDWKNENILMRATMTIDPAKLPPALRPMEAELSFDDIAAQGIIIDEKISNPESRPGNRVFAVTVTICTRRPPKFFIPVEVQVRYRGGVGTRAERRRGTAMDFAISGISERDAGPIRAIPEGPCAYPTFWRAYRFSFELEQDLYNKLKTCSKKFEALAKDEPEMDLLADTRRLRAVVLDSKTYNQLYGLPDLDALRFSTRASIEGLIAHGILQPGQVAQLWTALKKVAVVPAFQDRILENLYTEERIQNPTKVIEKRANYLRRNTVSTLSHLVMVRTVIVTPTRLVISPPKQEPSNSVTRRYAKKIDSIIRVVFADEEDKLYVLDGTREHDKSRPDVGVMARVRRALQHGITLGGRRFTPVASSASQQKEHAIWFIDPKEIDGIELRQWMGNVEETIVAKHAARMGLPFSTSRIVELNIQMGALLQDIKRGGYCFTDGVGAAGKEVMREAAKALGHNQGINATPSAIQIRLGGAKGVLAYWPQLARDHEVRLRPSMIKFESKLQDLNVVRLAKYQTAFLNRQFIMIMAANGIPDSLFVELFQKAVANIKGLRERVKRDLMSKEDFTLIGMSDFPLTAMIKAGFNKDPLVLDIAELIECRALQDLKWRARVKLEQGVFMIGIADETGLLKENEVFCQYQDTDQAQPIVVKAECLICRAPALHPGDVRRCFAVDVPQLRHLKNVIVFNTKGGRDLPNMLGGGDLDGDDYTLIWDPRFVRPLRNQTPMDYSAPVPDTVERVTQAHLNENFVKYMLNDFLGQVDTWHLALSDRYTPFHESCMRLSQIHSTAVDFAKTGKAAELPSDLRPKEWPDFMDKDNNKVIYLSKKVLGIIFRIVQPDPHFRPSDLKDLRYPTDRRITRFSIFDNMIERLKPIKARYEADMQYDMRRVSEPEIPSGIAIKNKRRKRAKDQNLNEPLRDSYEAHVRLARETAEASLAGFSFPGTLDNMQVIARHAYALTYEREYVEKWEQEQQQNGDWGANVQWDEDGNMAREPLRQRPMTTFAWVFGPELISIANIPYP